ncbi:MAG: hypothetical protein MJZ02_00235 [Paludibacteraceae bacterium]|nr:hypothetical protein [Paludibacteraceae bacterium]
MKKVFTLAMAFAAVLAQPVLAQDETTEAPKESKVKVDAGADLVSTYIWRGQNLSGAAFQPTVSMSVGGFSLGVWGSADFQHGINEFDWTASYSVSGFTIGLTDYCGAAARQEDGTFPKYGNYDNHILEANAGFDFSEVCNKFALNISANVNLVNDKDAEGDEQFSTYIELGYPVKAGSVGLDFAVGLTPFEGVYSDNFNIVNLSVKASKELQFTPSFSLPVYAQGMINPYSEQAYLAFGITF